MKNFILKGIDRDGNWVTWSDYGWSGADATGVSLEDCTQIIAFQRMINDYTKYHKTFEPVTNLLIVKMAHAD